WGLRFDGSPWSDGTSTSGGRLRAFTGAHALPCHEVNALPCAQDAHALALETHPTATPHPRLATVTAPLRFAEWCQHVRRGDPWLPPRCGRAGPRHRRGPGSVATSRACARSPCCSWCCSTPVWRCSPAGTWAWTCSS